VTSLEPAGGNPIRPWMFEKYPVGQASLFLRDEPRGLRCLWAYGNGKLSPYVSSICRDSSTPGPTWRSWLVFLLLLIYLIQAQNLHSFKLLLSLSLVMFAFFFF